MDERGMKETIGCVKKDKKEKFGGGRRKHRKTWCLGKEAEVINI